MDVPRIELSLNRAPDDPPENDPGFQAELTAFGTALHDAGVAYSQSAITFDSIDAHGYPLAEFAIQQLGPSAITGVAAIIGAWVHARVGRSVRLKVGDVEAEAHTSEEVEQLVGKGHELQSRSGDQDHDVS